MLSSEHHTHAVETEKEEIAMYKIKKGAKANYKIS